MIDDLTRYTEADMDWLEKSGQVTVSIGENGEKLFSRAAQGVQWIWPSGEAARHTPEYLEVMAALVKGDVVHEEEVNGKKVYTVKDKRPADPGRAGPKTIQELKKENLELGTEVARLEVLHLMHKEQQDDNKTKEIRIIQDNGSWKVINHEGSTLDATRTRAQAEESVAILEQFPEYGGRWP